MKNQHLSQGKQGIFTLLSSVEKGIFTKLPYKLQERIAHVMLKMPFVSTVPLSESRAEIRKAARMQVVKELEQSHHFICLEDTEELYVYDGGRSFHCKDVSAGVRETQVGFHGKYVSAGKPEKLIEQAVRKQLGDDCTKSDLTESIAMVKVDSKVDADFFEVANKRLIPLLNGVLDLDTMTLEDYDPQNKDHRFRNLINIFYAPDVQCPAIDKFLHEIFNSEEEVQAVYEFFGYCLLRDYPVAKAFMLVGDGSNGKTTLLNLLNKFLGEENISNLELQSICHERFATAELRGKLANIYDDLKYDALKDTGRFKYLTGNGLIDAEIKCVQRRVKFRNYAKMIFSTNKIPPNRNDETTAFLRRWVIFQMSNTFTNEKGNCDMNLIEKLTDSEELQGLLVKAVEGLQRLLKDGKFSFEPSIEETKASWVRDSIKDFIEEQIEQDFNAFVPKQAVYEAFLVYAENNNGIKYDERTFGMKFKAEIAVRDGQATVNGIKGVHVYHGIRIKETTKITTLT